MNLEFLYLLGIFSFAYLKLDSRLKSGSSSFASGIFKAVPPIG
ncbi:hypothetical protein [Facklamia miroungae]|uniref:Uncharacterized protein n=1 Tax=Facklamia miroungae TaxID=120956 RepID=A0A1G7V4F3_9LACT|nr:hypothetical protein [Facklamia miroungae]SDG54249.1 hypothetical protein SAMN05421791_11417 [Facklamia miroungae]